MLELDSVSTRAGDFRLQNVSLQVGEGESHVLLGPSGSGKTTLLETILGVRQPESGRITLAGRDLDGIPIERRGIGYLPQRLALFPHLTAARNILYGPRSRRQPAAHYQPIVETLVEATGIASLLDRRPETLSGGEQQRVALVTALSSQPRLLLLDEPFSALNESLRQELWGLLKRLQATYGFAALLITHDLTEAFYLADRITILIGGVVHQTGSKDEVWRHPATLAVAEYFGIRNVFEGTVVQTDAGVAEVECPVLRGRLLVPVPPGRPRPPQGRRVWVGIRPEYVVLRDAEHPARPDEFALEGRITEILVTGRLATLHFRPHGSDVVLELSVGRRLLRRADLSIDQTVIAALPARDLLLLDP